MDAVAWGRQVLSSLHAQESLAGALLGAGTGATAAGEALAELAEGRRRGLSDEELMERHPVLLALLPPTFGDRPPLPAQTGWYTAPRGVGALPVREGLRLRIRWVQEMQAQMVRELAQRVDTERCGFGSSRLVLLRWEELVEAADGKGLPADLAERLPREDTGPLPAAFRLADGHPVAQLPPGHRASGEGQGPAAASAPEPPGTATASAPPTLCSWCALSTPRWPRCCRVWPGSSRRPAAPCPTSPCSPANTGCPPRLACPEPSTASPPAQR